MCAFDQLPAELQHNVSKLEAASTETVTPIEQIRVQTEQLERQRVQLLEQIARLQQERDVSSSSMQRLLSSTLAYKAQLAALEEQQAKHVPQRRHWIQLYQNISAMKFDYSVPAEEALEGCECSTVSPPASHRGATALQALPCTATHCGLCASLSLSSMQS